MSGLRVAFQGEPGAYSEAAALESCGPEALAIPCASFDELFAAVQSGAADRGAAPVENSQAGSIHRNYDLLVQHNLWVVGEYFLRVRHCLIGLPGAPRAGLRKVISHPQALAQCEGAIKRWGLAQEPVYDTAGAVKMVKQSGDPAVAAIASRRAAEVFEMQVFEEGVEDNDTNTTRFLILAREPLQESEIQPGGSYKTSLVFAVKHQPGALFKALAALALRDINLTKIESRPLPGSLWEYLFYIDLEGSVYDPAVRRALDQLGEIAPFLRVFGSYPKG